MKSLIIGFIASCFLSPLCADIVYLKNGKQIECITAWEEGKEVKYKIPGGTMGIPRSMVSKIVKSEYTKTPTAPPSQPAEIPSQFLTAPANPARAESTPSSNLKSHDELCAMHTNRGVKLIDQRDFAGALEEFEQAHELVKDEETAQNLALIHYVLKNDFNAEIYFNEVLQKNPRSVVAYEFLGEIAWRKDNLTAAKSYWKKLLSLEDNPKIREKLARLEKEHAASEKYEARSSRHFLIKYDGGEADSSLVQEVTDVLEEIYRDLSTQYEIYPSDPMIVILYPRQQFFQILDLPRWSAGANDGKIKLPVKGLTSVTDEMRTLLKHELSHSFVNYKASKSCPAWLQEGLAEHSEGEVVSPEATKVLAELIKSGKLPTFNQLEGSFASADARTASVLYAQSLAFINYLIERYQFFEINELLDRLGKGESIEKAFENTYLASLSQMEETWRASLLD